MFCSRESTSPSAYQLEAAECASRPPAASELGMVLIQSLRSIRHLETDDPSTTAYMRSRVTNLAGEIPSLENHWRRLREISPYLVAAVVKAEDPAFFEHHGIAWSFVWAAIRDRLHGHGFRGASTITQQLARNLYLSSDRSLLRKGREALLARVMEHALTKERILEIYINAIEWGRGIWGAEAAARVYCGRGSAEVGPFEAIVLASLLPAPTQPLRGRNLARACASQARTLRQLCRAGIVDAAEARYVAIQLTLLARALQRRDSLAPALARVRAHTGASCSCHRLRVTVSQLLNTRCGYERDRLWKSYARQQTQATGVPEGTPKRR